MQTYLWFVTVCLYFNGGFVGKRRGRGSFGLVFVVRNRQGGKVVIKTLLSEDDPEKRLFIKEAKILHGITISQV